MDETVIIRNHNEVYLKIDCSPGIAFELKDAFTFMVPGAQFSPRYRARLWDGKISLFDMRTRQIYRGLIEQVIAFCNKRNYVYVYEDEEAAQEFSLQEAKEFAANLKLPFEPKDYQYAYFVHAIRNKRSLLLSPTSSGKSLIIYMIMRWLLSEKPDSKILIIVPNISLVAQLSADFVNYGFDPNLIHQIFQGKEKTTDLPVTVSTWQSLYTLPPSYFKQYTAVLGDECHLFQAKSLSTIMTNLTNASYRIGTTGTLDQSKTHRLVLEGLFGQVKKIVTTKDLMDQKHIADFRIKCLVLKYPIEDAQAARKYTYQEEIEFLVGNSQRNNFIRNLALSLESNTLILFQYVEKHGKILEKLISEKVTNRKVFFVYGNTDVDAREEIRKIVETEKDAIIIASYGVYSTGINIKNLHNIIFASPSKSRIRNLQSIGRGLRKSETKTTAILYDIADDLSYKKHENYTLKHFSERIKLYSEERFNFKIYKIDIKGSKS